MKRSLLVFAAIVTLLLLVAAPAQASTAPAQPRLVATLPYGDMGSFAESMTAVNGGNLYASLTLWADSNTGQIWRITPSGAASLVASKNLGETGALMGITHDSSGRLYVAMAEFNGTDPSLIYEIGTGGSMTVVAELLPGSWPNGLVCRGGYLYAADSSLGAIWRIPLGGGVVKPASPWFESGLLAPGDPSTDTSARGIGANGITVRGANLYVAVSDFGRIVRIPISAHGKPAVLCTRSALRSVDGIAVDLHGKLWAVTNEGPTAGQSGALYTISPAGSVRQVAVSPGWFDYPTQPVFGTTAATATTLFITNGAFSGDAAPNVIGLNVHAPGQPLP